MRHTCASLLYNNGVELHTIAKIPGNSEEVLRKTYVHFEEDNLISAMEAIADIEKYPAHSRDFSRELADQYNYSMIHSSWYNPIYAVSMLHKRITES